MPTQDTSLLQQIGREGETVSQRYLTDLGVLVVDRNIKLGHYEIDLVGWEGEELIIIEVKSSAKRLTSSLEGFVSKKQQHNLIAATQQYLERNKLQPKSIRYDLLLVSYTLTNPTVSHIKNAFHPFLM